MDERVSRKETLGGGGEMIFNSVSPPCLPNPQMNVSPCGVAFLPAQMRRGVLPIMLEEILNTRLMVSEDEAIEGRNG